MENVDELLSRALVATSTGGAIGAAIGGSVSSVFGPFAASGAAVGGLVAQWPVLLFLCAQTFWAEHSHNASVRRRYFVI